MDLQNFEIGFVSSIEDKNCKIKIGEIVYELDQLHGPVLVPSGLMVSDKVKVIVVSGAVRHIEKLQADEEAKIKAGAAILQEQKPLPKIQKRIKADKFFSVYDKGFQQKVYMYKVGDNDFKGTAKPKKDGHRHPHTKEVKEEAKV